jgi:hypothetical protein
VAGHLELRHRTGADISKPPVIHRKVFQSSCMI